MKYTLITFKPDHDGANPAKLGTGSGALADILATTAKHRSDVCEGVYIFETRPGWPSLHRLRTYLAETRREFVELQFEEGLSGFFTSGTCEKLGQIGIECESLLNLAE